MKIISCLFILFFLSFLCVNTHAQETKVKKKNGLTTVIFETPKGKVTVTLPEKTHAGDVISGTVIAEPKGKNEKQKKKNKNILNGYVVELEKKKDPVKKEKVTWKIPRVLDKAKTDLLLKNEKGMVLRKIALPVIESPRNGSLSGTLSTIDYQIPEYFRGGEPELITGIFDGDLGNTKVILDGEEIEILAESPSEIFVITPEETNGKVLIDLHENELSVKREINVIHLEMEAKRLSLRKGDKTTVSIEVAGIENLDCEIPLSISNLSSDNIELDGGDYQMMFIKPASIRYKKSFRIETGVKAISSGGFSISAEILPFKRNAYFSSQAEGN